MTTVLKTKFVVDSRKTLINFSPNPVGTLKIHLVLRQSFNRFSSCSIEKPNDSAVLMTASLTVALVLINVSAVQSHFQQNLDGTDAIISNSHKKSEQLFPRV